MAPRTICLLGFGEVGGVLAAELAGAEGVRLRAWDRQFGNPSSIPSMQLAASPFVRPAVEARTAASDCELVISAVTAAQDLAAAESVLPGMAPGTWFLDLNSVAPATKQAVARRVDAAGARYVEGVILSAIEPRRLQSPMLAGGPHARTFVDTARGLGFTGMDYYAASIGQAAATKLCRSVIVKGMEALFAEALLAARRYGVEDAVLDSLQQLAVDGDWHAQARYLLDRSLRHGRRRAEEMREAALTVADAGIDPLMSEACARRQDWAGALGLGAAEDSLAATLDAVLGTQSIPPPAPQAAPA